MSKRVGRRDLLGLIQAASTLPSCRKSWALCQRIKWAFRDKSVYLSSPEIKLSIQLGALLWYYGSNATHTINRLYLYKAELKKVLKLCEEDLWAYLFTRHLERHCIPVCKQLQFRWHYKFYKHNWNLNRFKSVYILHILRRKLSSWNVKSFCFYHP